ncbi:MAG: substrate-binding periplasmic protein [Pseudoalteromonas spongiae]|uniref:substrate-binding periplasmic protein n=1 Tax=Pseudoalteromonas sp. NFXS39 TaxID=2818437 RepID=UPI0015BAEBED|nr:transporter substrate-binding domain-containing protein [Pseudoalteromonas shioyasakiensis]QWV03810.1 transporter substrate-binding domain-containing protein [Pseudoalteromonas shioyasakiensis]
MPFRSLLIAIMLLCISCATAADNLTFIAEDLPPYHFINQQGEADGALIEVIEATLAQADLAGEFRIMPMARAFHELENNPNILMISLLKNPAREAKFKWLGQTYFSDAYLVDLASQSQNHEVQSLKQAEKYRVATIRGYSSEHYLKQAGFSEDKNLVLVSHYHQLWQMLEKERIDFVLTNTLTLQNELVLSNVEAKKIHKSLHLDDFPSELYLAANLNLNPDTAMRLSIALSTLKETGQYQAILEKWQLPLPTAPK